MKPTKEDIPAYLSFTQNIDSKNIDPMINAAFKFDLQPVLGTLGNDLLALQASESVTKPQLTAFYNDYVIEWWILLAMKRFLEKHGYNITQFGLTKTKDPDGTFEQLTPSERAVQIKQIDHDVDILKTKALDQAWTFDLVSYRKSSECKPRSSGTWGIRPIG